ncbi:unnamed protein product, partial [marine sediment metagenome]
MYPGGLEGHGQFSQIAGKVKAAGEGKKYDCVVGVSGGCDSSYMLWRLKEAYGLRVLAVHFDNGWNGEIGAENLRKITRGLDVDLEMVQPDKQEFRSIQRAFLEAGSVDIETASDIGLAAALYRTAHKYGLQYIMEGHNFRTEGSWPLGWLYMDGRYINEMCKKYGRWPLRSYGNMTMWDMFHWMGWHGIKKL